jgi:hypothetical protein
MKRHMKNIHGYESGDEEDHADDDGTTQQAVGETVEEVEFEESFDD